jgi:hypothetical protein
LNLKYDLAKNQISKKLLKICGMGSFMVLS